MGLFNAFVLHSTPVPITFTQYSLILINSNLSILLEIPIRRLCTPYLEALSQDSNSLHISFPIIYFRRLNKTTSDSEQFCFRLNQMFGSFVPFCVRMCGTHVFVCVCVFVSDYRKVPNEIGRW